MSPNSSWFFDELAKFMASATDTAQNVRRNVDSVAQSQLERMLTGLKLVKQEEFEIVRDMVGKMREENDQLRARLETLEQKISSLG